LSNLKNSLKSDGRWIVAIENLAHEFNRLQSFRRSTCQPETLFIGLLEKRCNFKGPSIHLCRAKHIHSF